MACTGLCALAALLPLHARAQGDPAIAPDERVEGRTQAEWSQATYTIDVE